MSPTLGRSVAVKAAGPCSCGWKGVGLGEGFLKMRATVCPPCSHADGNVLAGSWRGKMKRREGLTCPQTPLASPTEMRATLPLDADPGTWSLPRVGWTGNAQGLG